MRNTKVEEVHWEHPAEAKTMGNGEAIAVSGQHTLFMQSHIIRTHTVETM